MRSRYQHRRLKESCDEPFAYTDTPWCVASFYQEHAKHSHDGTRMLVLIVSMVALLALVSHTRPDACIRLLCRGWLSLRLGLGWICIIVGILGLILPIVPGIPFLAAGIALVGRRDPVLRRVIITLKLRLRRWAQAARDVPATGRYGLRLVVALVRYRSTERSSPYRHNGPGHPWMTKQPKE